MADDRYFEARLWDIIAEIRVEPIDATYWDAPSGRLATFWEVAKASVTQRRPDSGEVRKVYLG